MEESDITRSRTQRPDVRIDRTLGWAERSRPRVLCPGAQRRTEFLRVAIAAVGALGLCSSVLAQLPPAQVRSDASPPSTQPSAGDLMPPLNLLSKAALSDPILPADTRIEARKVSTWNKGDSQLLLLEGDIVFSVGSYGFRGDRAVVRIDTQSLPGRSVRHFSAYINNATPLRGNGPVTAEAPRLFVTASTTGDVRLSTNLLEERDASTDPLVVAAEQRRERYLISLATRTQPVPTGSPLFSPEAQALRQARRQEIARDADDRLAKTIERRINEIAAKQQAQKEAQETARIEAVEMAHAPESTTPPQPPPGVSPQTLANRAQARVKANKVLPGQGVVSFSADKVVFDQNDATSPYIALMGRVRLMYQDSDTGRTMTLTADNAVLFPSPQAMQRLANKQAGAEDLRGIYLEDNVVATDGQYTIRAPRVYYDIPANKAVVLDAVLYAFEPTVRVPLYMRAEKLMQESRTVFSAENAMVTTSEFAEPHFAVAANRMTFEKELAPSTASSTAITGQEEQAVDPQSAPGRWKFTAETVGPSMSGNTVKFFPKLAGYAEETPMRAIAVSNNHTGMNVRTTWDVFGLADEVAPTGVDAAARVDYLGEHGPGLGLDLKYDLPRMYGFLDGYFVADDQGEDRIGGRTDIGHADDQRGFFLWRNRNFLTADRTWELSLEAAYVSDPTFLEEFRRDQADNSKPYETSAYLKKQEQDWAMTFLAAYDLNEFTPQTTLLQTPGYYTEKLPEAGYYRVATPLWDDRLTYYTENRISRLRASAGRDKPSDRGFTEKLSQQLFGMPAEQRFTDALYETGFPDGYVTRGDTRHEIQAPMKFGDFDLIPYAVGRATAYDDDFAEFNNGEGNDNTRLWGAVGTRFHTQFSRAYDRVEDPLLDLHRLRHIVEPSLDLFYAGTTVDATDIPVFDPDVESLSDGGGVKLGLRNTLQTQRGGPGRYRSVDWLVVNTDLVLRSNEGDAQQDKLMPRYYSYRPEYSLGGDHFFSDAAWQVTEALSAVGAVTYNLESSDIAQWRAAINMRHTPQLTSYVEYTDLEFLDSQLLGYGFTYDLTTKYAIAFKQTYDVRAQNARSTQVTLERRLPRWRLIGLVSHDGIDRDTTVGFVIVPEGLPGGRFANPLINRLQQD